MFLTFILYHYKTIVQSYEGIFRRSGKQVVVIREESLGNTTIVQFLYLHGCVCAMQNTYFRHHLEEHGMFALFFSFAITFPLELMQSALGGDRLLKPH